MFDRMNESMNTYINKWTKSWMSGWMGIELLGQQRLTMDLAGGGEKREEVVPCWAGLLASSTRQIQSTPVLHLKGPPASPRPPRPPPVLKQLCFLS